MPEDWSFRVVGEVVAVSSDVRHAAAVGELDAEAKKLVG
jgi:hypothetical protein